MPRVWTDAENDLAVAAYLDMLAKELAGDAFVKREHNRNIRQALDRSHGSVEFKWQNVSAVLLGMGLPWIAGYKPAPNFQGSLVDAVLRAKPGKLLLQPKAHTAAASAAGAASPDQSSKSGLMVGPVPTVSELASAAERSRAKVAGFFDAAAQDARNRAVGEAGERTVLEYERGRLAATGREDLASAVEWVSKTQGDGLGYDIASFTAQGAARQLEVKSTAGYATTPFYISRNESEVAESNTESWRLVRVWDVGRAPRAFMLRPPLADHLVLTAESYRAALRPAP